MIRPHIARLVANSAAYNSVNMRTIKVFIQTAPGVPSGANYGIQDLEYQILLNGTVVQRGQTPQDGCIDVRIGPGISPTLRVLGCEYSISQLITLHPIEEMRGVQQRLEMLGYHTGTLHGDATRADTYNNPNEDLERAMLNFQSDNNLFPDAMFGTKSNRALRRLIRNTRGE